MTAATPCVPAWLGWLLCGCLLAVPSAFGGVPDSPGQPGNGKNPQAVAEVLAGKRSVANAAWWGFNEEDATEPLQAAIRSGAKRVVVPNLGKDWMVRPLQLAGGQELVLEAGVVVTAMRGAYRGGGESVFNANDLTNLTIQGYGATVRMQKEDYIVGKVLKDMGWHRWFGPYEKAEWRMTLAIRGCAGVQVRGLTLRDSGGDGIIVQGTAKRNYSKDIHLKDLVCDNHYRQGLSVISVDGLLVEDSTFRNTWGTPPSSGVDLEPDTPAERLKNVVFRRCLFEDNYGDGIEVFLANQTRVSEDVSVLFDQCRVTSRRGAGIRVARVGDDGPGGLIEFRDCEVAGTVGYGLKVRDKSADRARVRFTRCHVKDAASNRNFADVWAPVVLEASASDRQRKLGGVEFVDCRVEDTHARPALVARSESGLFDVAGTLTVVNPRGLQADLGEKQEGVTLRVIQTGTPAVRHVKVYAVPGRFGGWPALRPARHRRAHGLLRQWPSRLPGVPDGIQAGWPRGQAALRPHERRRSHLEVCLVDCARSERLRDHALYGAAG